MAVRPLRQTGILDKITGLFVSQTVDFAISHAALRLIVVPRLSNFVPNSRYPWRDHGNDQPAIRGENAVRFGQDIHSVWNVIESGDDCHGIERLIFEGQVCGIFYKALNVAPIVNIAADTIAIIANQGVETTTYVEQPPPDMGENDANAPSHEK